MTFHPPATTPRTLLMLAALILPSCDSDAKQPKAASASGTPATPGAAAKPAPAPAGKPSATAEPAATPTPAPAGPTAACIRAGTYRATSKGPFFLADEAGKLPPPPERKQKLDEVRDCGVHPSFDVTLTVATDGPTPTITFEDETLHAEGIAASDCHLRFGVRVDDAPTMLSRAAFDLDFSTPSPTASAKDVWLSIQLDGEAGENVVDCAAESIPIVLATKPGK